MSIVNLTLDNFEQEVLLVDRPVLVDFWAPWCGPCRALAPQIEQIAAEADGRYTVGKVNVDEQDELASRYGIMSIPTVIVFRNGEVSRTMVGVQTIGKLRGLLAVSGVKTE